MARPKRKYLYVKSETDEYALPEFVADSPKELASKLGRPVGSVLTMICRQYGGFYKVPLEEET